MGLQRRGIVFKTLGGLLVSVHYQAVIVDGGNFRRDVNRCRAHPGIRVVCKYIIAFFSLVCANELQMHRPYCVGVAA